MSPLRTLVFAPLRARRARGVAAAPMTTAYSEGIGVIVDAFVVVVIAGSADRRLDGGSLIVGARRRGAPSTCRRWPCDHVRVMARSSSSGPGPFGEEE